MTMAKARLAWIRDELARSQAAVEAELGRLLALSEDVDRLDAEPEELILLGYVHASVIGIHRPDVAYPTRKVKRSATSITTIHTEPCPCPDRHTEVWVRPVADQDLQQRLFY